MIIKYNKMIIIIVEDTRNLGKPDVDLSVLAVYPAESWAPRVRPHESVDVDVLYTAATTVSTSRTLTGHRADRSGWVR